MCIVRAPMRTRPYVVFYASVLLAAGLYACQDTFPSQLSIYNPDSGPDDFDAAEPGVDGGPDVEQADASSPDANEDAPSKVDAPSDAPSDHETDASDAGEPSDAHADGDAT